MTLFNRVPIAPRDNRVDCRSSDSEQERDLSLQDVPSSVHIANLLNLRFGKHRVLPALSVFGRGDRLQVIGVDTSANTTQVVKLQPSRDGAMHSLIHHSMGSSHSTFGACEPIVASHRSLPYPTRGIVSAIFHYIHWRQETRVVTMNEPNRFTTNTTPSHVAVARDWRGLTASAHAKARGVRGTMKLHSGVTPNQSFRGDVPRAATNSAGAFCAISLYQIPHGYGYLEGGK